MLLLKNKSVLLTCLVGLFLMVSHSKTFAQIEYYQEENEKVPLSERLYFGGNLGLQFGYVTYIEVSPLVGVMVTDRYSAGLGITYQYLKYKDFGESSNVYGGRIFNRYNILPNLFAHAEYENLSVEAYKQDDFGRIVSEREWVPGLFLGGGYFVPFGRRGGMNFTLLYNVLYDNQNLIYTEPYVIRLGFVL
ncbi:hypothetical protein DN752_07655 [Echinicola strongylocentroti]|uniref:Outer membrane protein beta-barrel domain-containing protein n=1 Tax=Echinicola strongylocentroti TaxID=1795355 RepID=A0A2Z4IHN5_9BACT|nr:hypothetical protein [Echinicola strongylocentroti]AWW30008.1 hypothetical protein DN752_07655 [Echinicola strongylocentroti]